MKINDVLAKKLEEIRMTDEEVKHLNDIANKVISQLNGQGLKASVGGSLAKGTVVRKNNQDVDVFVVFSSEEEIETFADKISKIDFGGDVRSVHGSRDYFQVFMDDVKVELIPTVETDNPEDANNVTDVSLQHVKYVSSVLLKNPDLADEIRLAKVFCQAQKVYGAESYIHGFSGYSLEVLVIYFGGFVSFLKGLGKKRVIDPKKYFKNEKEVLFELNSSKLQGPLVVVDPTYKYRNVTAGLGEESYSRFLEVAKRFLKKPNLDYFESKDVSVNDFKKMAASKRASLYVLDIESDRQEGDIVGTKCKKFFDFFSEELGRNGQKVLHREFEYSGSGATARGYLIVSENLEVEFRGPPKSLGPAVEVYKKGNPECYLKGNYYYVKKKVSVSELFNKANEVGEEMGAWGKSISNG